MAHQKINHVLMLLLVVGLFFGCRKESKEYTTVIWEVVNPVTNTPYVNMLVRLYEVKATNDGKEYKLIYEGKTDSQGRTKYSFKAALSTGYWYWPEVNEGSLGVKGVDYSVIKQPSPSSYLIKKDEENLVRYEFVPYGDYVQHTKNIDCQGSDDKMRYRRKFIFTGDNDFGNWHPINFQEDEYINGCYDNLSSNIETPSDSILYEIEVTKNGITDILYKTFYVGPEEVDTIKIHY